MKTKTIFCGIVFLFLSTSALGLIDTQNTQLKPDCSFEDGHNSYCTNRDILDEGWNETFGGSNIDVGHSVDQTTDGGYIITGYTRSYGTSGRNVWLIKTDADGNELWNNTFGGTDDDEGKSVQQTTDGGYIITGYSKSYGDGDEDVICIKTDANGDQDWMKIFGGDNDDAGSAVQQTSDGGYIIAGYTWSYANGGADVWLIKLNADGDQEWSKNHGGLSSDGAWSVQQTTDHGFIITGWTFSHGPGYLGNVWLVKTDDEGNEEWNHAYGGTDADRGYAVKQTTDGGYIIAGYTGSFGAGLYDLLLLKTDDAGIESWNHTFGGSGRDYGNAVQQTTDGGYIIVGYTLSFGAGGDDIWLIKTDENGDQEFDQTYGGTASDVGYDVQQTSDGAYIIVGHTLSYGAGVHDVWLIKTAASAISYSLTLNTGWNFVSLPFNQSLLKNNITVSFSGSNYTWSNAVSISILSNFVFGWNRGGQYYTFADTLNPGFGYWVFAYEDCELWLEEITPNSDDYITTLEPGWNVIGLPFDQSIDKVDVLVDDVSWNTAVANGWISTYVYGWNQSGQYYTFADTFNPNYSYWVYASQTCTLKRNS